MTKKKTSKKQSFCFEDMPALKPKKGIKLKKSRAVEYFKDPKEVGYALLQCLENNDPDAFIEILDAYLGVNRMQVAKKANLSRSTVQLAFSKKGNPSIKTIAKIVHSSKKAA